MNEGRPLAAEVLRRSAAHLVVDDLDAPVLGDRDAHHLVRVRRIRRDETVTITDGRGRWRTAHVSFDGFSELGEVQHEPSSGEPIELMVAIPKQDRPEWIVQKATELGATRIVWLHADRSVVRWEGDRAERHLTRLRTVAVEAVSQSRRVVVPEIVGPLSTLEALTDASVVLAEPGGRPLRASDRRIAIGPEGGWSEAESAMASAKVSLGDHVLRVETAALAACALIGTAPVDPGQV